MGNFWENHFFLLSTRKNGFFLEKRVLAIFCDQSKFFCSNSGYGTKQCESKQSFYWETFLFTMMSKWFQNDFKMISCHANLSGRQSFDFQMVFSPFLGTIFRFFGNYFSFFGNYFLLFWELFFIFWELFSIFDGERLCLSFLWESRGPVLSRNKQSQWTCTNGLTRAIKMIIWMCRWFCILQIMYIYCIARWPLVWVVFDGNSICFFLFWGFLYFFDDLLVHILWTKKTKYLIRTNQASLRDRHRLIMFPVSINLFSIFSYIVLK